MAMKISDYDLNMPPTENLTEKEKQQRTEVSTHFYF